MGKATAKKDKKYGQPVQEQLPLDEQIAQGRVAKSKTSNKFKLRLRAEEEGVSTYIKCFKLLSLYYFLPLVCRCQVNAEDSNGRAAATGRVQCGRQLRTGSGADAAKSIEGRQTGCATAETPQIG